MKTGSKVQIIFGVSVLDSERYGVAEINENLRVTSFEEKLINPNFNFTLSGLYYLYNMVVDKAEKLKKSQKSELEIVSLLSQCLEQDALNLIMPKTKKVWIDCEAVQSLNIASNCVRRVS